MKIILKEKKSSHSQFTNGNMREKTPDGSREDFRQKSSSISEQSLPKSPVPESTADEITSHQSKTSESNFTPVPAPRKPKGKN